LPRRISRAINITPSFASEERTPKSTSAQARMAPFRKHEPNIVLLLSLAKYERDEVDYHHRMITNGLAIVITVALMATGVWLASTLHE
jgi:hypothetical protein